MTATRDPVSRRRRVPVLAVRRALRRGSHRPRRAAEAVKEVARPVARQQHVSVLRSTVAKAWDDRVLGLSAEAAFWQLLSLAPLFLGLLGSIGYLSGFLGATTINQVEESLLDASRRAFAPSVVDQIITPTIDEVLRRGRADVVSFGFLIALWAGSSATATFVNTVTIAYGMRDLRGAVQSRLLALGLYLLTVVIGIVLLPVMVIGPGRLVRFFPRSAQGDVETIIQTTYWPLVAVLLLVGLVTFYHLAPPRRLPWRRGLPGAALAALVFVGGTFGLREYINFVVGSGLTYGALAAPIGALLFFYILALAVLLGAEFNATIEQTWPTRTRRPKGRRRKGSESPEESEESPDRSQPSRPSDASRPTDESQPASSAPDRSELPHPAPPTDGSHPPRASELRPPDPLPANELQPRKADGVRRQEPPAADAG
jgi:membrane protein